MDGLCAQKSHRGVVSRGNTAISPRKMNPKRKKIDPCSPGNGHKKAFLRERFSNPGIFSPRCSVPSNTFFLSPQRSSLPSLPSNLSTIFSITQTSSFGDACRFQSVKRDSRNLIPKTPRRKPDNTHLLIISTSPLGPDRSDLPESIFGKFRPTGIGEKWSGSVCSFSPPPSSLPLPSFALKNKGSCRSDVIAAGDQIDYGATDKLRRMIRLHSV